VTFAGSDLPYQFLPDYTALAGRLRNGELPSWNPLQGQPFLATLIPGTLYPARLLLLVLDVPTAMHVSTVLHLVLSLVATFLLCRALGTGGLAAITGAAAFVGIHALPALGWPNFLEGGAWLPVAALALVRLAATASFGWSIVLGMALGLCVLAGCYQHALYAIYALALLALALLADPARRGRLASPAVMVRLVVAAVVAVATAAPQALPTLAWSAETIRSGVPLTDAQLDPYPWPMLVWERMFPGLGDENALAVTIPVGLLALLGCVTHRRFGVVLSSRPRRRSSSASVAGRPPSRCSACCPDSRRSGCRIASSSWWRSSWRSAPRSASTSCGAGGGSVASWRRSAPSRWPSICLRPAASSLRCRGPCPSRRWEARPPCWRRWNASPTAAGRCSRVPRTWTASRSSSPACTASATSKITTRCRRVGSPRTCWRSSASRCARTPPCSSAFFR
jgi:hypothetical protein